jgi:hypothetical protein
MRNALCALVALLIVKPSVLWPQIQTPVGVVVGNDSLNYQVMRDALNARWIQGYGGNLTEHRRIETATGSIFNVISVRNQLIVKSSSEQRRIEAEDPVDGSGLREYFAVKATGEDVISVARHCRPADHGAICTSRHGTEMSGQHLPGIGADPDRCRDWPVN